MLPKVSYPSKAAAQKAAEAMSSRHGVHFSVYKCAWCDGWHVGKNAQNKVADKGKISLRIKSLSIKKRGRAEL